MGSWFFIYTDLASTKDNNHVIIHSKQQSKNHEPINADNRWVNGSIWNKRERFNIISAYYKTPVLEAIYPSYTYFQ
jgi:hypothetical protein